MTAPNVTADVLAYNFNLGTLDFVSALKRPPAESLLGQSLLHDLARENDVLTAETLIDRGADCDRTDAQGRTPLHEAAFFGSTEMASFLLDSGARLDAEVEPFGHTALYLAVERGHLSVAQLLIACGARLDAADSITGQGLLHMAAARGDMRMTGVLIAAGADVFMADKRGRTARDHAARRNHVGLERALLKVMEHRVRG
jgi:ankyrin repeat protein